jgi:hypothetical protein
MDLAAQGYRGAALRRLEERFDPSARSSSNLEKHKNREHH